MQTVCLAYWRQGWILLFFLIYKFKFIDLEKINSNSLTLQNLNSNLSTFETPNSNSSLTFKRVQIQSNPNAAIHHKRPLRIDKCVSLFYSMWEEKALTGYPYTSQKNISQKIIWLKNISPKIICQKNISLNVLFPELTIVRNYTCQNEHLPKWTQMNTVRNNNEITPGRMNTCLKLHLPEWTTVRNYISAKTYLPEFTLARMYIWPKLHLPENVFSRIYTCQNVHLAEITFPRKLIC